MEDRAHERFSRWAADGTWDRLKAHVIALAELDEGIDGNARGDATIVTPTNTPPVPVQGAAHDKSRAAQAISRSRGSLTTKIHTLADGRGRSLATRITPG
ncbi:hypothetical protein GSF22_06145 [Micromonospora echinofusca]|uniref:Transposase of IS4/5 family n=1 Tax=Micromonospora echinofusca TaxID=47858 RepID=A0ABS3VM50_MICEH|nr:hypothetical protein [Micromonospora echinofusca]MBO4205590.1 hypothetical protein [Micromonospora echinofusca]